MARIEPMRPAYPATAIAFDEWFGRLVILGGLAMGAIGFFAGVLNENVHWMKWMLAGIGLLVLGGALFVNALAIENLEASKTRIFGALRAPAQSYLGHLFGITGLVVGAIGFFAGVLNENAFWMHWVLAGIGLMLLAFGTFTDSLVAAFSERTALFGLLSGPPQVLLGRLFALGGLVMGAIGFFAGVLNENAHWMQWMLAGYGLVIASAGLAADSLATMRRRRTTGTTS